ncbi:MAG: hypothetical protein ACM30H_00100 [Clostridia bacterium]
MRAAVFALLALAAGAALAQEEDALSIADKAQLSAEQPRDLRLFVEGALRSSRQQSNGAALHGERLSFDLRYDKTFAPGLRAVFADRLDMDRFGANVPGDGNINTLKEAYVSWQPAPDRIGDIGRVNVRNGVATGYNPTDYFRANAVRSVVSVDPASLRENRLGTGMVRGQALWENGSATALFAPKLADQPTASPYSPDFGATNSRNRWLVAASQKVSESLAPQALLSGGAGQSTQLGFNVTSLLNDATVGFVEWSGGRSSSLAAQAGVKPGDEAFRSRLSTGLTYTTAGNLSLTAEYEYNGAAFRKGEWDAFRQGSPLLYGRYRTFVGNLQDLPTREAAFFYATWQDIFVKHLDLTGMLRYDVADHSRLQWMELRYHWPRFDVALQAQYNSGAPTTNFGALFERRALQVVVRYFL